MRNYIVYIILVTLFSGRLLAQTTTLADPVIALGKVALVAAITAQAGLKIDQKNIIKNLYNPEEDFFKKKNVAANFSNAPTTVYTYKLLDEIKNNIEEAREDIKEIKKIPRALRHGLVRHEGDLDKEEEYLKNLIGDNGSKLEDGLNQFTSGGTGYNKAAKLKIIIRGLEINARVKKKKNEIKNLRTLNRVIFKLN